MATCPHCRCRFRFRNQDGTPVVDEQSAQQGAAASPQPQATEPLSPPSAADPTLPNQADAPSEQARDTNGDDPLPPGAVVPHIPQDAIVPGEPAQEKGASSAAGQQEKTTSTPQREACPPSGTEAPTRATGQARPGSSGGLSGLLDRLFKKKGSASKTDGPSKNRVSVEDLRPGVPHAQDTEPTPPAADTSRDRRQQEHSGIDSTDVPWEQPARYGYPRGLYQTILQVLFSGPRFFAKLPSSYEGLAYPLAFYVILGMFQTLVDRMWYLMKIESLVPHMTDPKEQELLTQLADSLSLPMTLILTPGILAIQLFFFSGLFYLMFRLVQPEQGEFRTTFRVIAYSAAPSVVCIVPFVGPYASSIWFALCCFIGCKYALRLPWSRTLLALGPLYLVSIALGFQLAHRLVGM